MSSKNHTVLRVTRTKAQAKESYDRISRFYDSFAGVFEKKYRNMALERLNIERGETVLEIGFGTGHCLKQMAGSVGEDGKVCGIDISSGMLEVAKRRLEDAGLLDRVELRCGDAMEMPYEDNTFDAVFMSFALELFDSPEIPRVLAEIKRVLKRAGRLGVVSMSKEDGDSTLLRLYEWTHKKIPQYVDCRPIYVEQSIKDAGFEIQYREKVSLFGLPGEIVVGVSPS
jgi:ubiquinone/menaquinone biosynthesis C-methylase UbiE